MKIFLAFFLLVPIFSFGQLDTIQVKILAQHDGLNVSVVRVTLQDNHRKYNDYYVINNYYIIYQNDSLLFKHISGNFPEYIDTAYLSTKQLNGVGKQELILEYEYAGNHTYTGYHRILFIVDLDAMNLIFNTEIEARGQHFFGEEIGNHYGFRYQISFTDGGELIIKKPMTALDAYAEERYEILEGEYVMRE